MRRKKLGARKRSRTVARLAKPSLYVGTKKNMTRLRKAGRVVKGRRKTLRLAALIAALKKKTQ